MNLNTSVKPLINLDPYVSELLLLMKSNSGDVTMATSYTEK